MQTFDIDLIKCWYNKRSKIYKNVGTFVGNVGVEKMGCEHFFNITAVKNEWTKKKN